MMDHLYSNNIIATEQHSFVLKKSVVTNLLETGFKNRNEFKRLFITYFKNSRKILQKRVKIYDN
jgi:hypothetical protein